MFNAKISQEQRKNSIEMYPAQVSASQWLTLRKGEILPLTSGQLLKGAT